VEVEPGVMQLCMIIRTILDSVGPTVWACGSRWGESTGPDSACSRTTLSRIILSMLGPLLWEPTRRFTWCRATGLKSQ